MEAAPTGFADHQRDAELTPRLDHVPLIAPERVPWGWVDLAWVVGATLGGFAALLLLIFTVNFAFLTAERHHLLPFGSVTHFFGHLGPYERAVFVLLTSGLLYGVSFYVVYRHTVRKYGVPWSCLYLRAAGWRSYGMMVALYVPVAIGLGIVVLIEQAVLGHTISNPQQATFSGIPRLPLNVVLIFLAVAVLAPFVEEIVFRGFLYRLLRAHLPTWVAVTISAALFAAAHGIPILFPALFYLGVVLALVVERTKSLYCSMILHGMQNTVAVLAYFFITTKR